MFKVQTSTIANSNRSHDLASFNFEVGGRFNEDHLVPRLPQNSKKINFAQDAENNKEANALHKFESQSSALSFSSLTHTGTP